MADTIKLDGREFLGPQQGMTAEQEDYFNTTCTRAGVTALLRTIKVSTDDERAQAGIALYREITASGEKQTIMAGILTEIGKEWSREEAERNAERLKKTRSKEDKETMNHLVAALVMDFFRSGEALSATSPKSSPNPDAAPDTSNADLVTSEVSP